MKTLSKKTLFALTLLAFSTKSMWSIDHPVASNAELLELCLRANSEQAVGSVDELISKGADVNTKDDRGYTPLMRATREDSYTIAQVLIDHGADVNAVTRGGQIALILASERGIGKIVELLVNAGANINVIGNGGETALIAALTNGHKEIAEFLFTRKAEFDAKNIMTEFALICAVERKNTETVKILLDKGVNSNAVDFFRGRTALDVASEQGNKEMAAFLLNRNADVNVKKSWFRLFLRAPFLTTVMTWFMKALNVAALEYLAKRRVDDWSMPEIMFEMWDKTPLMAAAFRGHEEIIKLLLDHGADVHAVDNDGKTALDFALQRGHDAIVTLLLEHDARI